VTGGWNFVDQLSFLWPWWVILLPLPWVVRQLLPPVRRGAPLAVPTLYVTAREALKTMERLPVHRVQRFPIPIWAWWIWFLVVLAVMRPVWYLTPTSFMQEGKDIMLAVDLSGSMQKPDMHLRGASVERLTVVKEVVDEFIAQREHDRLGLVVFGSRAFVISPLTYDHNTVKAQLRDAQIGMAGENTALGDAIGLTIKHLKKVGKHRGVLILLTDGANTDGRVRPLEAAEKARAFGLKIYTVAIGRSHAGGGYDYDETILKQIAQLTGGQFYLAHNPEQLRDIYEEISRLESTVYAVHHYRAHTELYPWPLGVAFLLSMGVAFWYSRREGG